MTATIYGRHHYLFLHRCGCPFGLVEATRSALTEDGAWLHMYDRRKRAVTAAKARGVTALHVDHATYERDFYPLMTKTCPHR
jgi:hypothetical protein